MSQETFLPSAVALEVVFTQSSTQSMWCILPGNKSIYKACMAGTRTHMQLMCCQAPATTERIEMTLRPIRDPPCLHAHTVTRDLITCVARIKIQFSQKWQPFRSSSILVRSKLELPPLLIHFDCLLRITRATRLNTSPKSTKVQWNSNCIQVLKNFRSVLSRLDTLSIRTWLLHANKELIISEKIFLLKLVSSILIEWISKRWGRFD